MSLVIYSDFKVSAVDLCSYKNFRSIFGSPWTGTARIDYPVPLLSIIDTSLPYISASVSTVLSDLVLCFRVCRIKTCCFIWCASLFQNIQRQILSYSLSSEFLFFILSHIDLAWSSHVHIFFYKRVFHWNSIYL